ncbi:hypothetical protein SAMN06272737_14025 [Blastococcus mobilis]|uniref:Uncharacterized protein n=1 Tax=Blastococcus mobilis TaxID=1938746 RepID=A0A239ABK6_9ACTN|nr:hypothetical protein SAMN06272737_14025 [Blastococcus mobilis]
MTDILIAGVEAAGVLEALWAPMLWPVTPIDRPLPVRRPRPSTG